MVCNMLGYNNATNAPHDSAMCALFGGCLQEGLPFAMSGIKCNGTETHIADCPHEQTVSAKCGTDGHTRADGNDLVGVECE